MKYLLSTCTQTFKQKELNCIGLLVTETAGQQQWKTNYAFLICHSCQSHTLLNVTQSPRGLVADKTKLECVQKYMPVNYHYYFKELS